MDNKNSNSSNQANLTPPPKTLDYNSVCQMIGHLYIELHSSKSSLDSNYSAIIENLTTQVSELISENEALKEEIAESPIKE